MNQPLLLVSSEFPPQPGGIGMHAYQLAKQLQALGYAVEVVCDQRSEEGLEEQRFDGQQEFVVHRVAKRSVRLWMYLHRLYLVFRHLGSKEVCIASGKFSLWAVGFAQMFYRVKTLAVLHGTEVNLKSRLVNRSIRLALRGFDVLVAVSQFTKSLVASDFKAVEVIPNGIDLSDWPLEAPKHSSFEPGGPHLVTVGRVSERKGQHRVIAALPRLLQRYPELQYHCIGQDTAKAACVELAETLGVAAQVHFYGAVSEDDLLRRLQEMDLFVMLSGASDCGDVEGFGIAILEANALGIPAIGAKGSGVEDAIAEERSGILIEAGDAEGLVSAVEGILKQGPHFRTGARTWAEAHDWRLIVQRYQALMS